jgi:HAD superfamily phosphoserine phosphatase-like hydrolase
MIDESNRDSAGGAAFIRVEGVLLRRGALDAGAYFAANAQGLRERAFRLGHVAAAAVGFGLLGQNDRSVPTRLCWSALRGMSEDRLAVLTDEYVEARIRGAVLESGAELVRRARREGRRIVLISESIRPLVMPVAEALRGVDEVVCNALEIRDGEATGRLVEPVIGGHEGGAVLREYAREHGIDLAQSVAYGSHGTDLLMLSAVGAPCAVNADYTLRRAATDAGWAMLDYDA